MKSAFQSRSPTPKVEPIHLSCEHSLPPWVCISRKLESGAQAQHWTLILWRRTWLSFLVFVFVLFCKDLFIGKAELEREKGEDMGRTSWLGRLSLLPVVPASHMSNSLSPGCSTSHPALCYHAWGGGNSRRWLKYVDPCTHLRDLDEAPGSQLWTRKALAFAAIWEVNQRMESCLSLSLCDTIFQMNE